MTFKLPAHVDELDVAIIGMAGRFPGARNLQQYWSNLSNGVESIGSLTREQLEAAGVDPSEIDDPAFVPAAAVLDDVELFDAAFFGYSPREARLMDPQSRLFLECAWEAFETAGYNSRATAGVVGVYAAQSLSTYLLGQARESFNPTQFALSAGNLPAVLANASDFLPTRVSYKLHLTGPSVNVQTACSSSLVAVHLARQALVGGECDLALAGAVSIYLPQQTGYRFEEGMILSPDGHCRPFDAAARGTVFGRGAGVVLLKPLAKAIADGDRIRAVIKGSAVNNDGWNRAGYTAPGVEGQARVIAEALANAGVEAETISYVEAHGTGTAQGDPIEVAALTQAFRAGTERRQFCALGAVKSNIGHLDVAAGIAGLIKTVLMLEHKRLPPTLHYRAPNPQIDFERSPFFVNAALADWTGGDRVRRAGVSSFGMGGTNAHVILEEAPPLEPIEPAIDRPVHVLPLSARTPTALRDLSRRYLEHLTSNPGESLPDLCFTAALGRVHFDCRAALDVESVVNLKDKLAALAASDADRSGERTRNAAPRVAFLFTGQGAQYAGMARRLFETQPTFREALAACDEALRPHLSQPLLSVIFPASGEPNRLDDTAFTQPALFAVEYALAQMWRSWGIEPSAVLGHSVGEYVAACIAGVFSLHAALRLVAARGRLMQALPRDGGMAAVLAEESVVREAIAPFGASLSIAAVNALDSVVISGRQVALEQVLARLDAAGIRFHPLRVSHAFHSGLLDPMLDAFERVASDVRYAPPRIDVVSNVTGQRADAALLATPAYWRRHAREAVRFASGIQTLADLGCRVFLEVGPDPVLLGLGQRTVTSPDASWLASLRRTRDDWEQIAGTLAKLYELGVDVDWAAFDRPYPRRRVLLPTYPFQRERFWIDPESATNGVPSRASASAVPVAAGGDAGRPAGAALSDWTYSVEWQQVTTELPPAAIGADDVEAGQWVVFADRAGIGEGLARRLSDRGAVPLVVTADPGGEFLHRAGTVRIDPSRDEHWSTLGSLLRAHSAAPRIVHLWSLDAPPAGDQEADVASIAGGLELACGSALGLVQHLDLETAPRVWFVTRGAQLLESPSGPVSAVQAALWGFVRALACERPDLRTATLDLDPGPRDCVADLWAELQTNDAEDRIALRGGRRHAMRLVRVREGNESRQARRIRPDVTYLITGGIGALGLATARWLASHGARFLALTSRRAPSESSREAIRSLETQGVVVRWSECDVTRPEDVDRMAAEVEASMPPLGGVVHAAGVLDDAVVEKQTWPRSDQVVAPKALGAWNLHRRTIGQPLDFFIEFSSVASVLGSAGQSSYAVANAFLDGFAQYRHSLGLPAVSINWGPWSAGMAASMDARDRSRIERAGFTLISEAQATAVLDLALQHAAPQLVAAFVRWPDYLQQFDSKAVPPFLREVMSSGDSTAGGRARDAVRTAGNLAREVEAVPIKRRRAFLFDRVRAEAIRVLGLPSAVALDAQRPLNELGLDSLLAIELRNTLSRAIGRPLPATLLFRAPTVEALAETLLTELDAASDAARPLPAEPDVDAELERLTDDEVSDGLMAELEALARKGWAD